MSLQVTPAGRALFASLRSPDTTFTPVYQINLELPESELKEIVGHAEQVWENYKADNNLTKAKPKTFPEIKEDDNGNTRLVFKKKQLIKRRDGSELEQPPIPVYDSKKKRIDCEVPNGSEVKVGYKVTVKTFQNQYHVGLELGAVQVIKLQADNNYDSIFDEEEGYEGSESVVQEESFEEDDF